MAPTPVPSSHGIRDVGTPALQALSLTKRYRRGAVWALREVDLAIPQGTVTALVGPNGAGKSTLIRTFLGFERPTLGSVRVQGIDPRAHPREAIHRLGYLSQASGLYRGLTIADHFALAATLRPGFDTAGARDASRSWPSRSGSARATSPAASRPRWRWPSP